MPTPLHPAIVHFPIVLGLVLPLLALIAILRAGMGTPPGTAWRPVVVVAFLMLVCGFVALRSGQAQEERVEPVVGHDPIELHEHNAERLLWLSALGFVVSLAGLGKKRLGGAARGLTLLVMVVGALQLIWTAQSGGALVYEHGAANAYIEQAPPTADEPPATH